MRRVGRLALACCCLLAALAPEAQAQEVPPMAGDTTVGWKPFDVCREKPTGLARGRMDIGRTPSTCGGRGAWTRLVGEALEAELRSTGGIRAILADSEGHRATESARDPPKGSSKGGIGPLRGGCD